MASSGAGAGAKATPSPSLEPTEVDGRETGVADWMKEQLDAEVRRLAEQGAVVETMKVKNCGVVRQIDPSAGATKPKARKTARPRDKRRGKLKGKVVRKPAKLAAKPVHVLSPSLPATDTPSMPEAATEGATDAATAVAATTGGESAVAAATSDESDAPIDADDAATVVVNRIEIDTDYDFDNVSQLLHSAPIKCPIKEGFFMISVILFETRSPKPRMLPYIYDERTPGHSLQHWLFVNRELKESHHKVDFMEE